MKPVAVESALSSDVSGSGSVTTTATKSSLRSPTAVKIRLHVPTTTTSVVTTKEMDLRKSPLSSVPPSVPPSVSSIGWIHELLQKGDPTIWVSHIERTFQHLSPQLEFHGSHAGAQLNEKHCKLIMLTCVTSQAEYYAQSRDSPLIKIESEFLVRDLTSDKKIDVDKEEDHHLYSRRIDLILYNGTYTMIVEIKHIPISAITYVPGHRILPRRKSELVDWIRRTSSSPNIGAIRFTPYGELKEVTVATYTERVHQDQTLAYWNELMSIHHPMTCSLDPGSSKTTHLITIVMIGGRCYWKKQTKTSIRRSRTPKLSTTSTASATTTHAESLPIRKTLSHIQ